MSETIELNNIAPEQIEKLIDRYENKYSFDTNCFVDFIYYGVDENILGRNPKKYTIILNEEDSYKFILTNDSDVCNEWYDKHFKEYMER